MAKAFAFRIYKFAAMHDGRRVINVAASRSDAEANVRAIYPGYLVMPD